MYPWSCISLESPGVQERSHLGSFPAGSSGFPAITRSCTAESDVVSGGSGGKMSRNGSSETGSDVKVAGVLYKWTNYGKGWRSRWFLLKGGVLSYSKLHALQEIEVSDEVQVIGNALARINSSRGCRRHPKAGVVHLKVSSFRESKSDDKRFYIIAGTKTLHLRTDSRKDRVAWIEALASARILFPQSALNISLIQNEISISTEKLRCRLLEEGLSDALIKDCERIMLSEFSELQRQLKLLQEERFSLFDTLRQLEADNVDVETSELHTGQFRLKDDYSRHAHGKYSEWSTAESSDDIEKRELEELSDEDESTFFDTKECFNDSLVSTGSTVEITDHDSKILNVKSLPYNSEKMHATSELVDCKYPHVERRKKLPDPVEQEKGVSLWSMIKNNVGKDLTRVCLPVYFNEPISSLQKCFEDLEYSYLLDRAYEYGKMGNDLMRILNVAAFAVSGYASSEGRHCKPFNPLLGETYEADYPDKGIQFFSEKVSHHPMLIACHCEGKGWKFWGESNLRTKFWGRSIQLDPVGVLTLEFDDGEIFQWSKVTTTIYNLILGKVYCDHHGLMHIKGNRQYSCKLKFKEQSIIDRNPHQVHGFVEDTMGNKMATLFGKWDDCMYYVNGDGAGRPKGYSLKSEASLLWKRSNPPANLTRYNLSSFAITLNELTPGLQEKLPPTDSRLRPDQRRLENGEYEKANAEKLRLERRQRMSRKMQESGWKPRWFKRDGEEGPFRYAGGYWEAREQNKWDGCPCIFGQFLEDTVNS